ncbi:MAG: RNA polymerase factor sigma-54 [Campylobacterota bacterium]
MKLRATHQNLNKQKLSHVLQSWLPILKADIEDLEKTVKEYAKDNPLVQVHSGYEKEYVQKQNPRSQATAESSNYLENIIFNQQSLYEKLFAQVDSSLFPTQTSQDIAQAIIENLDEDGYFIGDTTSMATQLGVKDAQIESVRQRFIYLEPCGIGAKDLQECFMFQLFDMELEEGLYELCQKMIQELEQMSRYKDETGYEKALKVIQSFKNPPAIEYLENSSVIKPDFFVFFDDSGLHIELNSDYYPVIEISNPEIEHEYIKQKLKEAKNIVDSLDMRKATLKKIGLMVVEYQYDFFLGGNLRPLLLQDFAQEFGYNISTISRAIAGKYLSCDRGVYELKYFFSSGQNDEVSQNSVKQKLKEMIEGEPRSKPLSDQKLADMINEEFELNLGRRTITKYRKQLHIGSSSDRKKFYKLT